MASATVSICFSSIAVCHPGLYPRCPPQPAFLARCWSSLIWWAASSSSLSIRTIPTSRCMTSCKSCCSWNGFSPSLSLSKGVSAQAVISSTCTLSTSVAEFSFAYFAAYSPARFPKTRRSESELPPRRFAPWRPAAHSPAAKRPGVVVICVSASTLTPPIM